MRAANLFMRSRSCTDPAERRGCRFYIASSDDGGEIVEVETDPRDPNLLLIAEFCPATHLHWVETATGTEGNDDPLFLRDINFDNAWVAGKLLSEKPAAVRLAPREPAAREPVVCRSCEMRFGSPAEDPLVWVQHYGAELCQAAGFAFRCYECSWAAALEGASPLPQPLFHR